MDKRNLIWLIILITLMVLVRFNVMSMAENTAKETFSFLVRHFLLSLVLQQFPYEIKEKHIKFTLWGLGFCIVCAIVGIIFDWTYLIMLGISAIVISLRYWVCNSKNPLAYFNK